MQQVACCGTLIKGNRLIFKGEACAHCLPENRDSRLLSVSCGEYFLQFAEGNRRAKG